MTKRRLTWAVSAALCAMAAAAGTALAATGTWIVQSTPNRGGAADLNAVSCLSSTACVAVGGTQSGFGPKIATTRTEVWNGSSWIQGTSRRGSLSGVSCWASNGCMAVGGTDHNEPLAQIWNGNSWKTLRLAKTRTGGGGFAAISCWSENRCIAVGFDWHHTITRASKALAERWNGLKWKLLRTPAIAESDLQAVSCWSRLGCIAVGQYSTRASTQAGLAEVWNGREWKVQKTPNPANWMTSSVSCWSSRGCIAAGDGALTELWNGRSWKRQKVPRAGGPEFRGVSCSSPSSCIAVGDTTTPKFQAAAEVWNGHTWQVQHPPLLPDHGFLEGVSCWSGTGCTAVGAHDLAPNANKPLAETLG